MKILLSKSVDESKLTCYIGAPCELRSPIAQLVEQVAVNHLVASSSLARGASFFHL